MKDIFFEVNHCQRCGKTPLMARIMSWFTNQAICMDCSNKEDEIRKKLPNNGRDFEGCGYIPNTGG